MPRKTDGATLSLVIFDCDGVLFDSWRANVAYYNAVLARLGLPPLDEEWMSQAHVLGSTQLYDAMFGVGTELAERAQRAGSDVDYEPFYGDMRPSEGLEVLLASLKRRYRLAMATNRGSTVDGVVTRFGLDRFFDLAVGVRDVARPKPHPDMIERCLTHFGTPAKEAVYVGDAPTDRQAALAAGVHFIGVGDLTGAPLSVSDLRDLPARLAVLEGE